MAPLLIAAFSVPVTVNDQHVDNWETPDGDATDGAIAVFRQATKQHHVVSIFVSTLEKTARFTDIAVYPIKFGGLSCSTIEL